MKVFSFLNFLLLWSFASSHPLANFPHHMTATSQRGWMLTYTSSETPEASHCIFSNWCSCKAVEHIQGYIYHLQHTWAHRHQRVATVVMSFCLQVTTFQIVEPQLMKVGEETLISNMAGVICMDSLTSTPPYTTVHSASHPWLCEYELLSSIQTTGFK